MAAVPIVVQQTDKLCSTGMTMASLLKGTVNCFNEFIVGFLVANSL